MYAIVKTGGKQYKVAPGDIIEIEKLDAAEGDKITLEAICIVDGDKVEADPAKASATKVEAVVLEAFKGEKQLVFKFKKRKNYKRTKGHRQQLMRVRIEAVGSAKAEKMAAPKKAAKKDEVGEEAPKKATAKKEPAKKEEAAKETPAKETKEAPAAEEVKEEVKEAAEEAAEAAEAASEE